MRGSAARDIPPALPPLRDRRPRKARAARLASTPRRWTRLGAKTALWSSPELVDTWGAGVRKERDERKHTTVPSEV